MYPNLFNVSMFANVCFLNFEIPVPVLLCIVAPLKRAFLGYRYMILLIPKV